MVVQTRDRANSAKFKSSLGWRKDNRGPINYNDCVFHDFFPTTSEATTLVICDSLTQARQPLSGRVFWTCSGGMFGSVRCLASSLSQPLEQIFSMESLGEGSQMPPEREYHELPTSTSTSLLEKAKVGDPSAWERLVRLYFPLVYGWCARKGASPEDCLDIAQEVFVAVSVNMYQFRKTNGRGSFRGWLRTITENKLIDHGRRRQRQTDPVGGSQAKELLAELPDPEDLEIRDSAGPDDRLIVFRTAAELVRNEFEARTWDAFWRVTAESRPVEAVAEELGMTSNAVYVAKSRVLRRLREILGDTFENI